MSMAREFRDFAARGNVVDLAVAVIVGAAFGKIVASLVGDIVMPLVGTLLGGLDFSSLAIQIGAAKIRYGRFIQACVDFLLIAACIFAAVRLVGRFRRKDEAKPPAPPPRQEKLLEEIRDLLKSRQ